MQKKLDTTVTTPVPFTSKILQQRHGDSDSNKIDGFNERRGEGLPYSTGPATPAAPYTSAILLARHGNFANKIDGMNSSRGEGLPFTVVEQQCDVDMGQEGFVPPSTKLPSSMFVPSVITSADLANMTLPEGNGPVSFSLKRS